MASFYSDGNDLFVDEDYDGALVKFSAAIAENDQNADYFVKRSATHAKLHSFAEALEDANAALALDPLSDKAYFRKG